MLIISSLFGLILSGYFLIRICSSVLKDVPKWLVLALFGIKLIAAIGIVNYYRSAEEREMADVFKYYDDGLILAESFYDSPSTFVSTLLFKESEDPVFNKYISELKYWGSNEKLNNVYGNRLLIRVNALLSIVFFKNYYLHVIVFTFLSLIGLLLLVHRFKIHLNLSSNIILTLLVLCPSSLFWSSGLVKESLIVALLGLLMYLTKGITRKTTFVAACLIWMLFALKPPILLCLLPFIFSTFLVHSSLKSSSTNIVVSILCTAAIALVSMQILDMNPAEIITQKQADFQEIATVNDIGSGIDPIEISNTMDLLVKSPMALINTLFRPSILEVRKLSYLPFALESLLLILLPLLMIPYYKSSESRPRLLFLTLLFFIIGFAIITGLTVPILGSIVRYRAPIVPLYILLIAIHIDWNKINPKIVKSLE